MLNKDNCNNYDINPIKNPPPSQPDGGFLNQQKGLLIRGVNTHPANNASPYSAYEYS